MTRPTFYRIEIEEKAHDPESGVANRLGFCHAEGILCHYVDGKEGRKPMRSDSGQAILRWLPGVNGDARYLGALCWFTPKGWRKFEETGDMAKVFHRLVHFGVRYRVRRIPTDKVRPLYSDGLQALLPRHI